MTSPSLLIVGCGDLGLRVGGELGSRGWRIGAVRRHPPPQPGHFDWFSADYSTPGSLDFARDWQPDYLLFTPTPAGGDLQGYRAGFADGARNLLLGIGDHRPRHILMVSSTRVYAERNGGWVGEEDALSTSDERALAIIDAEQQLRQSGCPATVVRCGGIYGTTPGRLVARVARGEISPEEPRRYTNRIHREDAAGFLVHLLDRRNSGQAIEEVYNCVDDDPAPAHTVESWLARALGVTGRAGPGPAATASAGHKRCRNDRLHASGYALRYPDFRAGYSSALGAQDLDAAT